jgi:hypothetical protein
MEAAKSFGQMSGSNIASNPLFRSFSAYMAGDARHKYPRGRARGSSHEIQDII